MARSRSYNLSWTEYLSGLIRDYFQLMKFRLSATVVFSAAMGYLLGNYGQIVWTQLGWLILGGLSITGASNAINQIIEKDFDKLMNRTAKRPLPDNRMSVTSAAIFAGILGILGISILWFCLNPLAGFLGTLALLSYAFIYTPLKRVSPIAVFVGAIPGALPPMIGWVAATGMIQLEALILFSIQFIWQFPHFWSIAWVCDKDYRKAGFRMLPSAEGKGRSTALQTVLYALLLIPISLLPAKMGLTGIYSAVIVGVCGLFFLYQSIHLYRKCTDKAASKLMFGSFLYLPVVLLALVIDKL